VRDPLCRPEGREGDALSDRSVKVDEPLESTQSAQSDPCAIDAEECVLAGGEVQVGIAKKAPHLDPQRTTNAFSSILTE